MKTFAFCFKNDKSKEKIGSIQASSINEAIVQLAEQKDLSAYEFLNIFAVYEI